MSLCFVAVLSRFRALAARLLPVLSDIAKIIAVPVTVKTTLPGKKTLPTMTKSFEVSNEDLGEEVLVDKHESRSEPLSEDLKEKKLCL